ncbi:MAG TPA: cupredoxin domain-containing protein [Actinomycetota bacterium]|nr:cupredoxin domain-containing protein [Actinomycetota bacterium]
MTETRVAAPPPADEPAVIQKGFGWRKLVSVASYGNFVSLVILMGFIIREFIPPFAAVILLSLVGGFLSSRTGKAGVVGVVLAALGALGSLFFMGGHVASTGLIGVPEAINEYIPTFTIIVFALTILIASIVSALKRGGSGFARSNAARNVGALAVVLIAALSGWSTFKFFSYEEEPRAVGDIPVVAKDFAFRPESIGANDGTISVYVTNSDTTLHTFSIDELNVDTAIPAGRTAKVVFKAGDGTYRFYCKPHPDMEGELNVTPT